MKTPLKIETQESPFGDRCSTFDAAGFLICDNEDYYPQPVAPEHQARIVACVNACAGVDNPEAEIAALRSLVQTIPVLAVDYQRMARLEAALGCIASDRGDHPAILIAKGALNP